MSNVIEKSSFVGDVFKLAGGTGFAQVLMVLTTPIITRLYDPEAFGISALFTSITSIILVIVCLRYELAIMLPKKDEEAANLLGISLLSVASITMLSELFILAERHSIQELFRSPLLGQYLWLIPLSVFANGAILALTYWISRKKHFGRLSVARIASSVTSASTQLGAGFSGHAGGGSLIGASLLGAAASAIILISQIWRDDSHLLKSSINFRGMEEGLKRYHKFPLFDTWSALLTTISSQMPVFLLGMFFTPVVVGYYSISMMALMLPMNLIGSAIAQVFFQRAANAKFEGTLATLVEATVLRLWMIGFLPAVMGSIIGKEAFVVVFGVRWAEAGIYVQILSILALFMFVSSPISTLFSILERQEASLILNIFTLPICAGALIVGGYSGKPQIAILLFAFAEIIIYFAAFLWLNSMAGVSISKLLMKISKNTSFYIPIIFLIVLIRWIFYSNPLIIIIICGVIAAAYYAIIINNDKFMKDNFISLAKSILDRIGI